MSDSTNEEHRRCQTQDHIDRAVAAEVDAHMQMQIDDLVAAGWSPDAARAEALKLFGDIGRVKLQMREIDRNRERKVRRLQIVLDLRQDLRYALRQMRRRPGFAIVAIVILALGIGANTAVFSVVDAALVRPLPFPRDHELTLLWEGNDEGTSPTSYPDFRHWQERAEFLQAIATRYTASFTLLSNTGPERLSGMYLAGDFLAVLGLAPVLGRGFDKTDRDRETRVVMLSEHFWKSRFGADPTVLGTTLILNDESHTVIGVMPREASILVESRSASVWMPLVEREWMRASLHFLRVYGRLRSDVSRVQAQARADALALALTEEAVETSGILLQIVRERLVGDANTLLGVLAGAVAFLLLIVCTNLASLFLSHTTGRSREFAIRSALGAGRFRLARQIVVETTLLGLLGGVAGFVLSDVLLKQVAAAAERAATLAPTSAVDVRVAAFTLMLSLGAGLLFGLLPALRASRHDVAESLKESAAGRVSGSRTTWRQRKLLVGAEVAMSLVLLTGAALMLKSALLLLNEDPGFDANNVLALEVSLSAKRYDTAAKRVQFWDELMDRVVTLPGVADAGATSHLPLDGGDTNGTFVIVGQEYNEDNPPRTKKRIVTPRYFETMKIQLLRGRTFDWIDLGTNPDVVIISKDLADRYWPGENPVGKQLEFRWGTTGAQEIIGVVGDIRDQGLDIEGDGTTYVPHTLFGPSGLTVIVRTAVDPLTLVRPIRQAVLDIDPQQPVYGIQTLDSVVRSSIGARGIFAKLLAGFAAVALVLAGVGVYAITAQSVAARTQEIGIRMAIGADAGNLLGMVIWEELRVIAAGLTIGLASAFALTRTLEALLYQVSATDPRTFAAVTLLLGTAGLVAAFFPALRATRVDPATALRAE